VSARTTYDPNVPVFSTPPSGSFFATGTTMVTNVATSLAGQTASCTFVVKVVCDTRIELATVPGSLNLSWPGTATVERATNVTGPWVVVASGVSSYSASPTNKQSFFRVRY
jgi:hypothetical protein